MYVRQFCRFIFSFSLFGEVREHVRSVPDGLEKSDVSFCVRRKNTTVVTSCLDKR
jgi:hypothetical protein